MRHSTSNSDSLGRLASGAPHLNSFLRVCGAVAKALWWTAVRLGRAVAWLELWAYRWIRARPNRRYYVAAVAVIVALLGGYLVYLREYEGVLKESVDCLALNIYHEARGEPVEAQLAIAQVVANRIAHPRFPDNACNVVKQGGEWPHNRCQFSWWCDGRSDQVADARTMARIRPLARDVLLGKRRDPTDGAMWYHTKGVLPDWRKEFEQGPTIGDHVFYRLKDGKKE